MGHLNEWIGKILLLVGWTLIRIKSTVEIFKELEKTRTKDKLESLLVKLKSKFR